MTGALTFSSASARTESLSITKTKNELS